MSLFGIGKKASGKSKSGKIKSGNNKKQSGKMGVAKSRTQPVNKAKTVSLPQEAVPVVNTAMATHIGTREYQQDAAYVCEPLFEDELAFGILCDGMGGTAEGERASGDAVIFMANRIADLSEDESIPAFLEQTAYKANDLILEKNEQLRQDSGTTLITVVMQGNNLYWLSIGDSRIYIIRDGEMVQVTTDHNYALELQEKVDSGQLSQEEADADPKREHLISYIGAPYLERLDINSVPFQMQYGDIILLCSDGLTKALYTDEILSIVTRCGGNIAEAARLLPLEAFRVSPDVLDNTTVILMQYFGESFSVTTENAEIK